LEDRGGGLPGVHRRGRQGQRLLRCREQAAGDVDPAAARTARSATLMADPASPDGTAHSRLDELLTNNRRYAETFALGGFDGIARAGVAIVTCMDSRIEPLAMVGLTHGDAKIFRNPGGRITEAALEALVLGVHLLNVDHIMIVPHTRCAMTQMSENELREKVTQVS